MSKPSEVSIEDIKLGHNGENYVLNQITFTNLDGLKATYTFSTQESVTEEKAMTTSVLLKEIEVKPYDKMYLSKLYDDIEKDYEYNHNFDSSGGGAYISSTEAYGHHGVEIDGKKYLIYYAMSHNLPMHIITSAEFIIYTFMFFIFLSIAGVVFLIFCLKLNKKSEIIENSKRIFISAAAHELKTPLAVIQNQCECIIENVLPEKNEEYMATTGFIPPASKPAAKVTACSSAIPTSKKRSGYCLAKAIRPVPVGIAAVTPTILSFCSPSSNMVSENIFV